MDQSSVSVTAMQTSLSVVLDILGIKYRRDVSRQHVHCPLHDDTRPSCHVDLNAGWWRCYQCGASGTPMQLLSLAKGIGMADAFALYEQALHLVVPAKPTERERQDRPLPEMVPLVGTPVAVYLANRGVLRCAVASGVLACNTFEQYGWAACVPVKLQDHSVVGWQMRRLNKTAPRKVDTYGSISGAMFVPYMADAQRYIVLCEGPFDAMTLWEHKLPALATMGTALTTRRAEWVANTYSRILLSPDNDSAGQDARDRWTRQIKDVNQDVHISEIIPPLGTDWNESWKLDPKITKEALDIYRSMI